MNQITPGKDDFSKARTNPSHLKNNYFRTDRTFFSYISRVWFFSAFSYSKKIKFAFYLDGFILELP